MEPCFDFLRYICELVRRSTYLMINSALKGVIMWDLVEGRADEVAYQVLHDSIQCVWPDFNSDNILKALMSVILDAGRNAIPCHSALPLHALRDWARYAGAEVTENWVEESLAVLWQVPLRTVRASQSFVDSCASNTLSRFFETGRLAAEIAGAGFSSPKALLLQWFSDASEPPPMVSEYFVGYLYKETLRDKLERFSAVTEETGVMGIQVRRALKELTGKAALG